jgi:hypothetical protein
MALKLLRPLYADEEDGELGYASYKPWFQDHWSAVTPSQYMFLSANIKLFENGEISEEQAKQNELSFILKGWGQTG